MVQTAETDVVSPTVTTEDPLALLHQVILQVNDLLAVVTTAFLASGHNLVGQLGSSNTALTVVDPLLEEVFEFLVAAVAVGDCFLHDALHSVAHLAGSGGHTETELGVVLEQAVGPSHTLAASAVLAVRSGRRRTTVDGGTTGSVGHDHSLTEELRDGLDVRRLTATGTSTAELEQRLCELAVLDGGKFVDEVVLVGNLLLTILPVLCILKIAIGFLKIQFLLQALINNLQYRHHHYNSLNS